MHFLFKNAYEDQREIPNNMSNYKLKKKKKKLENIFLLTYFRKAYHKMNYVGKNVDNKFKIISSDIFRETKIKIF